MPTMPTLTADFFARLEAFVTARMDVRDQLEDLPDYKAIMGHRHVLRGRTLPVSIFQGEGLALYLFVQAFRPRVILDMFTGTGMAAAYLGAGHQFARVYSVDDYSEGVAGDAGWDGACGLIQACDLRNVKLIRGSHLDLARVLDADGVTRGDVDLLFLDGAGKDVSEAFDHPGAVRVTHDEPTWLGPNDFRLMGGSHLTFSVPPALLPMCHTILSPYFAIGVAEDVAWRPPAPPKQEVITWT
jgi:predicted O-methyltransferase YrrM